VEEVSFGWVDSREGLRGRSVGVLPVHVQGPMWMGVVNLCRVDSGTESTARSTNAVARKDLEMAPLLESSLFRTSARFHCLGHL
jgi:hypothetical protein